ncbi:unnamed protein product [Hymenolepis diminuta]|uniref:Uncharacterized protein n=1 Tax=Hymenolepis diminuta TaxID=6216 RepID=A0A564Y4Q6_HYMDI|nr:unnamed protein product [Hymenolepis diminuta]
MQAFMWRRFNSLLLNCHGQTAWSMVEDPLCLLQQDSLPSSHHHHHVTPQL